MYPLNFNFLPNPAGLYNTGSICYFNSLLQVLISCTSLHTWSSKSKTELEDAFKLFIDNSETLDPMASTNLLSALRKKVPSFGNGQESASEAFVFLLNSIDNAELNNLFTHRFRYTITCKRCSHKTKEVADTAILCEIFDTNNFTEKNLLCRKQVLNDYKCDNCNLTGATKISKLTMLPEILVCLFNVYYTKKNHNFPNMLEFPGSNNRKLKYLLVGQVEHSGSLNGGHYWSRAIRKDGIYLFNDNSYSKSELIPTVNTYLVVYHLFE